MGLVSSRSSKRSSCTSAATAATFVLAFSIPLFQLILFGFIDQTVHNVPTVVVDQDRSTESRELLDQLRATGTFRSCDVTANPHDARDEITAGRARVGIVIPPDYHDKRTRRQRRQDPRAHRRLRLDRVARRRWRRSTAWSPR